MLDGMMRRVIEGEISAKEAVPAYHDRLRALGLAPTLPLDQDSQITEAILKA